MSVGAACLGEGWAPGLFGAGTRRLAADFGVWARAEEREETDEAEELFESEAARLVCADPDRFLLLYDRYYERILNYLYRRTMNLDLAQDLTSRTFLQAFEHLRAAERSVRVRPWLYRIATNVHLSHGRRWTSWLKQIEAVGRELWSGTAPRPDAGLMERGDLSEEERLRRHLAALPDWDRTPLLLRYYEGLAYSEIARVLGGSEVGARSRVMRALRRLEKRMRQEAAREAIGREEKAP